MTNWRELFAAAEEAERLARVVSYGPDKEMLRARAHELRAQAQQLAARPSGGGLRSDPPETLTGPAWFRRRERGRSK